MSRVDSFGVSNRFSSPSYVRQLTNVTYKKQVVIKIVGKGFGKKHLSILVNYLQREHEAQKANGEKPAELYDTCGMALGPKDLRPLLAEWAGGFLSNGKTNEADEAVEVFASRYAELRATTP